MRPLPPPAPGARFAPIALSGTLRSERLDTWARPVALGGALLAVGVALVARGRLHPDELFQFLEPAHRVAFGTWVATWEWHEGLCNWAVPGLLGALLRAGAGAGLSHPHALAALVWCACALVQALGTLALYRLVAERDGRPEGLLAATLHVTWGGWVVYAARPLGDALSVAPLLGALMWAQRAREGDSARAGAWCGALLGAAFVVRYPSAVFGLPLAGSLLLARRWRALAAFAVGGAAVLLALGLLDLWTWGRAWHSVGAYLRFNVLSGGAATRFGAMPWWWYAPIFAGMAPLLLTLHFARGLARRDVVVGAFGTYLGALALTAHKEARFLLPLLPLWLAVAAAPAWHALTTRLTARRARLALGLAHALSSLAAATVLLPTGFERPTADAFVAAGRAEGLTGLLIAGMPSTRGTGYFHLHRDVPLRFALDEGADWRTLLHGDGRLSHVLVRGESADAVSLREAGLCPLERSGRLALWRRCGHAPAPGPPGEEPARRGAAAP